MKVLWICNRAIPVAAKHLHIDCGNKEGWLAGLSEKLLSLKEENLELGICFPLNDRPNLNERCEVAVYTFAEDPVRFELYDEALEGRFREIFEDFKPDVIHIFGTEYSHTLAACLAFEKKEKILVGIQGLCSVYAEHYFDGLPENVINGNTLRDFLKKDNIAEQKAKFEERGRHEIKALSLTGNVTGRTDWDRHYTGVFAPDAEYHFMNETLRSNFYEGAWKFENCEEYSIFVSQGDYPIKGLHVLLEAFPSVLKKYPKARLYVAGNRITGEESLKKKILIGSYGKWINKLLKKGGIKDKVIFLGSLNAEEMKERYLKSNLYLSPSMMENSPNSVGEAMILGMPVVSSDVGGVTNLLSDKEEGFVYPSLDKEALVNSICDAFALNGSERQKEMGKAAARHANITHNPENNCRRLLEIYREIVNK